MTNLGELSLFNYIENYQDNECNMKYVPIYLYQIVTCLIKYNRHIFHNDMKVENIVIDISKKKSYNNRFWFIYYSIYSVNKLRISTTTTRIYFI